MRFSEYRNDDPEQGPRANSSTTRIQRHEPCGFAYQLLSVDPRFYEPPVIVRGEHCAKEFIERLQADAQRVREWLRHQAPMPELTAEQQEYFDTATHCFICDKKFEWFHDKKRDHCHVTGVFRGPAHGRCNLNYRIVADTIPIPCFLHNLKNYDAHLIIAATSKEHGEIKCIPSNAEKYISFTIGGVEFKDTYVFMQANLDKLVDDLKPEELVNTRRYLEMVEMGKRSSGDGDNERVRSEEEDAPDSDDEAFIDDCDMPPLIDDCDDNDEEEVVQWVGEEIERLITPDQCYRFVESDIDDDTTLMHKDVRPTLRPDLVSDDDDEGEEDQRASHLLNQHQYLNDDAYAIEDPEDMVRAAERAAEDYRNQPFVPPQLCADEDARVTAELQLVKRKGVYPYEYMDSFERFLETQLPPQDAFFSHLKGKGVSDKDYAHACRVWDVNAAKKRNKYTLGDYHDFYLLTDVLLLADVMHNFRELCLKNYKLDPWRFHTVPGLTLSAGLQMTNVAIDLIEDVDMHLFIEAGMRGGVACVSKRLAETSDDCDENGFRDFLLYLDANNLYGWAMSQPLPTGNYRWLTDEELK